MPFWDFALRRYRAFMLERRELHALAARELRLSLADDQRLERVRLLVRRKAAAHRGRRRGRSPRTGAARTGAFHVGILEATSEMGHSRPSEASSEFGHVRYAAESGRKFRVLAAPRRM